MKTILKVTSCILALGVISTSPALASGGGGGGGFNTQSGPTYDPVKDYQEGVSYLRDKNYKQAERSFSRVIKGTKRNANANYYICLLYTSPSPRDRTRSRMPSSA